MDAEDKYGNAFMNAYNTSMMLSNIVMWPVSACDLNEKGTGLFTLSRYEEATEFFNRAIAVNPDFALAYIRLAAPPCAGLHKGGRKSCRLVRLPDQGAGMPSHSR